LDQIKALDEAKFWPGFYSKQLPLLRVQAILGSNSRRLHIYMYNVARYSAMQIFVIKLDFFAG
jgi:hypothetical protein